MLILTAATDVFHFLVVLKTKLIDIFDHFETRDSDFLDLLAMLLGNQFLDSEIQAILI